MKASLLMQVHPLLSDRVRLAIMAALCSSAEPLDFTTLLSALELTRGNLSIHLRKLEQGKLLKTKKQFVERKPRSTYEVTEEGRKAVKEYLKRLEGALKGSTI